MYADTLLVHVREGHELAQSCHLVSHLALSGIVVYGFLVLCSMTFRTTVVLNVDDVAALCHIHFPESYLAQPAVVDHL